MRNAGLEEAQAGIRIARRNINNLRYADDTTLIAEGEEKFQFILHSGHKPANKGVKVKFPEKSISRC